MKCTKWAIGCILTVCIQTEKKSDHLQRIRLRVLFHRLKTYIAFKTNVKSNIKYLPNQYILSIAKLKFFLSFAFGGNEFAFRTGNE